MRTVKFITEFLYQVAMVIISDNLRNFGYEKETKDIRVYSDISEGTFELSNVKLYTSITSTEHELLSIKKQAAEEIGKDILNISKLRDSIWLSVPDDSWRFTISKSGVMLLKVKTRTYEKVIKSDNVVGYLG